MAYVLHKMWIHGDKDYNYGIGDEELNLQGEVLRNFAYTNYEVELTMETNTDTGESRIIKVDGVPLLTSIHPEAISLEEYQSGPSCDDDYLKRLGVK